MLKLINGMKIISRSLEETEEIAKNFLEKISVGVYDKALVIGLYGDLGSGKTTFVQDIAKIFGVKEFVTSPTFVIEKMYPIRARGASPSSNGAGNINHSFKKIVHIDAYRIDSGKELLSLGWEEIILDPQNLILIEWPEKVKSILPENYAKIFFKFMSDKEREIEI